MDDLIDRQAAIDAINKAFERVFAWDGTAVTCSGSRSPERCSATRCRNGSSLTAMNSGRS